MHFMAFLRLIQFQLFTANLISATLLVTYYLCVVQMHSLTGGCNPKKQSLPYFCHSWVYFLLFFVLVFLFFLVFDYLTLNDDIQTLYIIIQC